MKHFILYYHGGSNNHGCEALVRTTIELLDNKINKITLASFRPEEDIKYGIDKYCDVHKMYDQKSVSRLSPQWMKAYYHLKVKNNYYAMDDLAILSAVGAKKGDVALSIGGDNYCYNDTLGLVQANEIWRRNGIKTVLWGCSIEPELLNDDQIMDDISRFDLITARESISYEAIRKVNKNTFLVSDSAFHLRTKRILKPKGFDGKDIVGINSSPIVQEYEKNQGITIKNFEVLIEYILSETNMNILLIPHVVIPENDDRVINNMLYEKYKSSNRICCIDDCTCEELKGYISQCRLFVGARTHATIAAYSSAIPTLVLGYSVKSKGIAKDLFGDYRNFVVPVQTLRRQEDLLRAFCWILENEVEIKNKLTFQMKQYKSTVYPVVKLLERL